ncbi:MAG: hypothetical protein II085_00170 [Alphaproteobacteria bacterium]|nr:hypothetical protein [Alphaproteobacteria bacterium]
MAMKVNGIESEEDLKRAQAAAQAAGSAIPNYGDWAKVLQDLKTAGVDSTGSYEGDKALREEIAREIEQFMEEAQEEQIAQDNQKNEGIQDATENDKEQQIKANLANATSSMIMADYMKYYHLMS